jgi:predicted phosphoribosyltransferase
MIFHDRAEAGKFLATKLTRYANRPDVFVLALPRGGVPVAFEVAKALEVPLDLFIVRKLGFPGREEAAMGAIASGNVIVLNEPMLHELPIPRQVIQSVVDRERQELKRREKMYREGRPKLDVRGKTVILIDDGLATGSTMRAAAQALRKKSPKRLVVAVPVGAATTCDEFRSEVDEVVCGIEPPHFGAVGAWYQDFSQTSDEEVQWLLEEASRWSELNVSGHTS